MGNVYHCTGHELKIPHIETSRGIYLYDDQGDRYLDLESGVWCISVGHNNGRINRAIQNQLDAVMHGGFCYSSRILEEAAQAVLATTGMGNGKAVFLCSGSEAIEISRQIAKHLTGKNRSMTLHDSYLGAYSTVTNRTTGWYIFNWESCQACPKNENCDPACEAFQAIPADIADFIFEPGSASGFVRFPPKTLIQNLVNIVRRNHGKVIANEVTTGVGRTGTWFGYQHYGITPDMIAMGKGIGNGYPVSVAAISPATAGELQKKPIKYAQSHQNDPLGAAVVQEVIRVIEDNHLIPGAEEKGRRFRAQLESLVDLKIILGVRGRGLMLAVDLANGDLADEIYDDLIGNGFIVGNRGGTLRIDPPLIVTDSEFQEFMEAFKAIIHSKK